jgi:hypothetical protein
MTARNLGSALLLVAVVSAAAATPRDPCRDAQYGVEGDPLGTTTTSETVEAGTRVGVGGLCPLVPPTHLHMTRTGVTIVRAKWEGCP